MSDERMNNLILYTVGYQGYSIESFIELLLAHQIAHVLDVRQLPISRKPGFAKKGLAQRLSEAGIGYTHLFDLGTPKPLRDDVRQTKDHAHFFTQMTTYIAAQHTALQTALDLALSRRCALLCVEALPTECHRSVVARAIQQRAPVDLAVVDL